MFMKRLLIRTLRNVQLKDCQGNGLFVLFLCGKKGVFRGRGGKWAVPLGKMGCSTGEGGMDFSNNKTF